jgi:hypothetical protein
MRAITRCSGSLLGLLLAALISSAQQPWVTPVTRLPFPTAPDACGPGWYNQGPCGMVYGPNHYLVPPSWQPFCPSAPHPSMVPGMPAMPGVPRFEYPKPGPGRKEVYPTHPFARGPRDYFMWNESIEEQEGRSPRPALVP